MDQQDRARCWRRVRPGIRPVARTLPGRLRPARGGAASGRPSWPRARRARPGTPTGTGGAARAGPPANEGRSQQESDFYPYRYLASEGFIPGYNFPRLPLRCLVAGIANTEAIDRPRFLGLTEFGPNNLLYHEGRRHRVVATILPSGDLGQRLRSAKLCRTCGYAHAGDDFARDRCAFCNAELDGAGTELATQLLDQPTVRAQRQLRISSEEEERERLGYDVATHFRAGDARDRRTVRFAAPDGRLLLEATAVLRADLWRINHGWRQGGGRQGFALDRGTGRWVGRDGADVDGAGNVIRGLKPIVTDRRNLLFVRPLGVGNDDATLKTLAYALRRAAQLMFQIEEQELSAELIGERAHRRILLWELAEGGIGVAERLLAGTDAIPDLARAALGSSTAIPTPARITPIGPEVARQLLRLPAQLLEPDRSPVP